MAIEMLSVCCGRGFEHYRTVCTGTCALQTYKVATRHEAKCRWLPLVRVVCLFAATARVIMEKRWSIACRVWTFIHTQRPQNKSSDTPTVFVCVWVFLGVLPVAPAPDVIRCSTGMRENVVSNVALITGMWWEWNMNERKGFVKENVSWKFNFKYYWECFAT